MRQGSWLAFGVLLAASTAHATIYDTYGFGPRATAMGGAMTADARDFTAVFYNPALLVERKDVDFGFSFQWNKLQADVQRNDLARDIDCSYCSPPDSVGYSSPILSLEPTIQYRLKPGLAVSLGISMLVENPNVFSSNPTTPADGTHHLFSGVSGQPAPGSLVDCVQTL